MGATKGVRMHKFKFAPIAMGLKFAETLTDLFNKSWLVAFSLEAILNSEDLCHIYKSTLK